MGNTSRTPSQYQLLLQEYELLQKWENDGVLLLRSIQKQDQHLLREFTFTDRREFDAHVRMMERKKGQLQDCGYLLQLEQVLTHAEDQFCSAYFKLYAMFQWLPRSLDDQINQRSLQKRRFQEKELWSLAGTCVLALSHLQRQGVSHLCLASRTLLLTQTGAVRLYDPIASAASTNYEALLANRSSPHLYISPEEAESLQAELSSPRRNPFKTDIFTLGMVLLEAGLAQYQDQCYRDEWTRIHWETLQYNLNRFRQNYSQELTALLELMLSREETVRPDWLELQDRLLKADESLRVSARASHATSDRKSQQHRVSLPQTITRAGFPSFPQQNPSKPVSISLIAQSRPLRNLFPSPVYTTQTKADQNLIFVPDEYSQVSETPNREDSYFNSLTKPKQESTRELKNKQASSKAFSPYVPPVGQQNTEPSEFVVEKYRQGSEYRGQKWRGMRHGQGTFLYLDGGKYQGEWAFNKMQGHGSLYYQSGKLAYEGQWMNDQFSGKGILYNEYPQQLSEPYRYQSLDQLQDYWLRYEGHFRADMKHGTGAIYLSNGEIFDGQFMSDVAEGKGIFVRKDGRAIFGNWSNNKMIV